MIKYNKKILFNQFNMITFVLLILLRELVPLLNKQPIHSEIEKDHHTDEMLNVVG